MINKVQEFLVGDGNVEESAGYEDGHGYGDGADVGVSTTTGYSTIGNSGIGYNKHSERFVEYYGQCNADGIGTG